MYIKKCLILGLFVSYCLGADFYVAPNGSNNNTGAIDSPWHDLTHAAAQVKPGDTILIRGGVYRNSQQINSGNGAQSGTEENPIKIVNYPEETPRFLGSQNFSSLKQWYQVSDFVWRTEEKSIPAYDVGCVWHDEQPSEQKTALDQLKSPWDFWFDVEHQCIYLRCDSNPAAMARSIEIPVAKQWEHWIRLSGVHHWILDGLTIKYTNTHGIAMSGVHHITIRNCTVSHGGGAWIWENQPVRYGNAIELWSSGHDILVENCNISHYFDTGFTNQGDSGDQYNIFVRNNHFHHVKCALEHWATQTTNVRDVYYENNIIEYTGDNWANNLQNVWGAVRLMRFHPNGQGADIPNTGTVEKFYVRNNIIKQCGSSTGGMLQAESPFYEHPAIRAIGGPFSIENNIIVDSPAEGIYASNGFYGVIRDNLIVNSHWSGIHTKAISDNAVIQNNTLTNCGDATHPNYLKE